MTSDTKTTALKRTLERIEELREQVQELQAEVARMSTWSSILEPPTIPQDVIVCGENVSQRVMCSYSCWRWDGARWLSEDGTELATAAQMAGARWIPIPKMYQQVQRKFRGQQQGHLECK